MDKSSTFDQNSQTPCQCCGSGSVESVSFPWIRIRIRIKKWLDPESRSVSNDTDPEPFDADPDPTFQNDADPVILLLPSRYLTFFLPRLRFNLLISFNTKILLKNHPHCNKYIDTGNFNVFTTFCSCCQFNY